MTRKLWKEGRLLGDATQADDMPPLQGQVAVITGASRGIGRAIALELARLGADIVAVARSTDSTPSRVPGTIDETARQVQASGRRALAVAADITSVEGVQAMVEGALRHFGRVDILVNNAAYMYRAPFYRTPLSRWDLVLNVNLRGPVICIEALLPQMLKQRSGRVLNISSGAAVMVLPEMVSYSVSKAALETLTRGLSLELRDYGIVVNALRIETAVATEGAMFLNPGADFSGWETPQEVAKAAAWVLCQPASYTGRVATIAEVRDSMSGAQ